VRSPASKSIECNMQQLLRCSPFLLIAKKGSFTLLLYCYCSVTNANPFGHCSTRWMLTGRPCSSHWYFNPHIPEGQPFYDKYVIYPYRLEKSLLFTLPFLHWNMFFLFGKSGSRITMHRATQESLSVDHKSLHELLFYVKYMYCLQTSNVLV
jgi:hypothetical protein